MSRQIQRADDSPEVGEKNKDVMSRIFGKLMYFQEDVNKKLSEMSVHLLDFKSKYESDMRSLIDAFEEKNKEIRDYSLEVQKLKISEQKLKSDVTSLKTDITQKDVEIRDLKETLNKTMSAINKRACAIDGKLDCINVRNKLLYSEAVRSPNFHDVADSRAMESIKPKAVIHSPRKQQTVATDDSLAPNTLRHPRHDNQDESYSLEADDTEEDNPQQSQSRSVKFDGEWKRAFSGVSRSRNRRLVLSYVKADDPFDIVKDAIMDYADERGVSVTNTRLLRHWEGRNPTYTIRIAVSHQGAKIILEDKTFWPDNVNCREWVPRKAWYSKDTERENYY